MKLTARASRFRLGRPALKHAGSIYFLTLGLGLVLTLIGVASITAGRVGTRAMTDSQDWLEAQSLAFSAAEHAMLQIKNDANWRTTYNNQTVQKSLGRGTFNWRVTDETDNNLTDDVADPFVILATGTVGRAKYSMKVHMTPGGSGLAAGVTTSTGVSLTGSSSIDSYNSTLGAYGGSNVSSLAVVQTNATASRAVSLDWSTLIKGSVQVGPGGNPDTVVYQPSGTSVTGTRTAMAQAAQLPTVSAPTGLGASTGDYSVGGSTTTTVSGNLHVNNFTVGNSGRMRISGPVTVLVENNFNLNGSGVIEVLTGGSLTIYVRGSSTFSNSGQTVIDGQNLSSIMLYNLGTNTVTVSGSAGITQGVIISPNGPVTISGSGQLSGAVVTQQLSVLGSGRFHEDKRITSGVDRVSFGGSTSTRPDAWSRIVQ